MAFDTTDFVVTETPVPVRDPKSITDPRERVAYLRDHIAKLPRERFDMAVYSMGADYDDGDVRGPQVLHDCNTRACLCGWTVALFAIDAATDDEGAAASALGLDEDEWRALFIPRHKDRGQIENREAVAVLDHYLATGKIDWSVA